MFETMKRYALLICAALAFVGGGMFGWWAHRPKTVTQYEHAAPAVVQKDGSQIIERHESTPTPPPAVVQIPKGATEIRRAHLEIQPPRGVVISKPRANADSAENARLAVGALEKFVEFSDDSCDCPPVTVDLSLVEGKEGKRIVAKSNGTILSDYDLPIERPGKVARALPWAAGVTYNTDRSLGGFVDRDLGPFRFGVEGFHSTTGWTAQGRAGIRF